MKIRNFHAMLFCTLFMSTSPLARAEEEDSFSTKDTLKIAEHEAGAETKKATVEKRVEQNSEPESSVQEEYAELPVVEEDYEGDDEVSADQAEAPKVEEAVAERTPKSPPPYSSYKLVKPLLSDVQPHRKRGEQIEELKNDQHPVLEAGASLLVTAGLAYVGYKVFEHFNEAKFIDVAVKGPKVLLVGDSIFDNAAWHGVRAASTGALLKNRAFREENFGRDYIFPTFIDRSTEEVTTERFLRALSTSGRAATITVRKNYVLSRDVVGMIPYAGKRSPEGNAEVPIAAHADADIVFLSLGGNDIVLGKGLAGLGKPDEALKLIFSRIADICRWYKLHGAKRVVYTFPYSPDQKLIDFANGVGVDITALYHQMKVRKDDGSLKHLLGVDAILDLSDFTDEQRLSPNTGIPEPTQEGAKKIALRIAEMTQRLLHPPQY